MIERPDYGGRPRVSPIGKPLQHPARVLAVAFSPDGQLIATGLRRRRSQALGREPPATRWTVRSA